MKISVEEAEMGKLCDMLREKQKRKLNRKTKRKQQRK